MRIRVPDAVKRVPSRMAKERSTLIIKPDTSVQFLHALFGFVVLLLIATAAGAQDNYEIQVYASDLVPPGVTMVELHNNFTVKGSKQTDDGTLPTHQPWHETLEVTHGF